MNNAILRPFESADEERVIQLNLESESVLSPMNSARFSELRSMCSRLWIAELESEIVGFLMGFCDGAGYDSVNYRWFADRLKNFFYIDRVVVLDTVRSMGIGRKLYSEVYSWADTQQLAWVAAEIDLEPPNHGSLKFHDRQGFFEVGQQTAGDGSKTVSLRVRKIGA